MAVTRIKFHKTQDPNVVAENIGVVIDQATKMLTDHGREIGTFVEGTRYNAFNFNVSQETEAYIAAAENLEGAVVC